MANTLPNFIAYPQVNLQFSLTTDLVLYSVNQTLRYIVCFDSPTPDPVLGKVLYQVFTRSRTEFNTDITYITNLTLIEPRVVGNFSIPISFSGGSYFLICSVCYEKACSLNGRTFVSVGSIGVNNATTGKPPPNQITNPNSGIPFVPSSARRSFPLFGLAISLIYICVLSLK